MISYRMLGLIFLCAGMQLLMAGCRKQKEADAVRKLLSKDYEKIADLMEPTGRYMQKLFVR